MSETAKGKAVIMGDIEVVEDGDNYRHPMALVIVFDDAETIRQAIQEERVEFTIGDFTMAYSNNQRG